MWVAALVNQSLMILVQPTYLKKLLRRSYKRDLELADPPTKDVTHVKNRNVFGVGTYMLPSLALAASTRSCLTAQT